MDLDAIAAELAKRFIQRRDVKAIQNPDGTWRPDRSPWTKGDLRRHLRGDIVHGHYLVDPDGMCKLFALDIDLDKGAPRDLWHSSDSFGPDRTRQSREMLALAFGLAYRAHQLLDIPCSVAYSGSKGMHVYGFLPAPIGAIEAKALATGVLTKSWCNPVRTDLFWKNADTYPDFTIEVFPKQGEVREDGGLGNLMRLPLGKNHKGKRIPPPFDRPAFMAEANLEWTHDDPVAALRDGSTRSASEAWGHHR